MKCPNQCGTFPQRHMLERYVARDCLLTVVECDFNYTGCEVKLPRKDMQVHIKENVVTHISLLAVNHKKQQEEFVSHIKQQKDEIEALKEEVSLLKGHTGAFPIDFVVKIPHQYKYGSPWFSKHFYSHGGGYKLHLEFYFNPVFGYRFKSNLMQGEFDSQLKWPMKADIFMLMLHKHGEDLKFTITAECNKPVTGGRTHCCGQWSYGKSRDMNKYLLDSCLCLQITGTWLYV